MTLELEDGYEGVLCNCGVYRGIFQLGRESLPILVFSSVENFVIKAKYRKFGLESTQSLKDKQLALCIWAKESQFDLKNIVYMESDLECLKMIVCGVVVNDAL
jgi:hypothetical protein